jgi:hypothetical protein
MMKHDENTDRGRWRIECPHQISAPRYGELKIKLQF